MRKQFQEKVHQQGTTDSDQIMARALMTPDELRRMSMDYAIIYEKGLKPIKAKKFFYFKTNMIKEFNKFKLDHTEYNGGDRGKWRRFNPYNPDQGTSEEPEKDLKVDSLDDLFDDDTDSKSTPASNNISNNMTFNDLDDLLSDDKPNSSNKPRGISDSDLDELLSDDYSASNDDPTENDILDIQKELEAKFDELFGSSNDD